VAQRCTRTRRRPGNRSGKQVNDTKDEPMMQSKIKEHLEKTKRHAELVAGCITRNGGSVSGMKDAMSKFGAAVQGLGMSFMGDAQVKHIHSSYAAEHLEIATYTLLAAAADELDDDETSDICSEILKDEIDMANWLLEQLPDVVEKVLEEAA
jgi:ferritin-like metal-binding protein YciE